MSGGPSVRRGEIHGTRSKSRDATRVGPGIGRRDRLPSFARSDHARVGPGRGVANPDAPVRAEKSAVPSGSLPSGGRYRGSVASAVSPRRRGDLAKTHLSSRSSRPSGTTRDAVRARVSGSRARDNPYIRKTTRRQRPDWPHTKSSLRAISISKLTMGFGLDSVVFFRDWFDREVPTEGATAHGLATDEAECTEAGYPRSVRVIPERVGRETCRRSRR